jgi:hypothetical protein
MKSKMEIRNKLWLMAKDKEEPFFYVDKGSKWALIEYDLWPTQYDLKEEVCKYLYEFADNMLKETKQRVWRLCCFGKTSGFIKVRNDVLPIFEKEIREKVFDKKNWILCIPEEFIKKEVR